MRLTPQITWRQISRSETVEANIHERLAKLDRFYDRIMNCRVMVEAHQHKHQGNLYHIRIDLTLPGGELVINRDPSAHQAHEDIYVAVGDAFDAAERQLKDYARQQRGDTKTHAVPHHGRIANLFPEEGYGFIETADEREIYFHQNSLLDAEFDRLAVGQEVRFAEEEGDRGPQASTVTVVGKHHTKINGSWETPYLDVGEEQRHGELIRRQSFNS